MTFKINNDYCMENVIIFRNILDLCDEKNKHDVII